ncbi:MAG: hypothetical protein JSW08_02870 [archaeon]|nr:MAG: hypothetical protein JSW08_02870 [archaeon]
MSRVKAESLLTNGEYHRVIGETEKGFEYIWDAYQLGKSLDSLQRIAEDSLNAERERNADARKPDITIDAPEVDPESLKKAVMKMRREEKSGLRRVVDEVGREIGVPDND